MDFPKKRKRQSPDFEKNGRQSVVPDHGSKELGKGLERKLRKEMQL
jgi:mRNA interferase HicA